MTLSSFIILPEAQQDVDEIGYYLGERNFAAARRFARSVGDTIEMLLRNPNLGERLHANLLGEIRYRTVLPQKMTWQELPDFLSPGG